MSGDAYEGLLQKNAEDVKGGAGQYFTPRALTSAMVEVIAEEIAEDLRAALEQCNEIAQDLKE